MSDGVALELALLRRPAVTGRLFNAFFVDVMYKYGKKREPWLRAITIESQEMDMESRIKPGFNLFACYPFI